MAGQNVDLFDTYFRRADLDRDGRISGTEAVSFFLGSGLPKPVLAQIWVHADQHKTGFLGRAEFYNALKLVTVAQSRRELTPDIVKAALYGPASAKIPAPQINLSATPAPPTNPAAGAAVPQLSGVALSPSQNMGVRGPQVPSSATMGPNFFPPQQNQMGRPPRPATPNTAFHPQQVVASQGMPGMSTTAASQGLGTNNSSGWLGGVTAGSPGGVTTQVANRGIQPLTTSAKPTPNANSGLVQPPSSKPSDPILPSSHVIAKDSKQLADAGNGFASSDSLFGDVFSVTSEQPKQDGLLPSSSPGSLTVTPAIVPASTGLHSAVKPSPLGSLQSAFSQQPVGSQNQKGNQQVSVQSSAAFNSSNAGFPAAAGIPPSGQSQVPWPRMTQSDVQKYTKVFVEVDTDRDGKITGDQARNLFLSWRLPREILKQVWDLSDQDSDSMLSVREFCIALYLMERYRDGRPLPKTLPNGMFDETLFSASGQPAAAYGNATWRPTPGFQQAQAMAGAPPVTHVARGRPPKPVPVPLPDDPMQSVQRKSKVPVLEKHLVTQLSEEEQNALTTKFQEATVANKKVEELEKEILDAREKNEFYRSKMQELILYKSRCDNRLNEIIERTSADKREAESLAKKYEEKYKQTGDVASKLPLEEATFRDIQEKKMELYRAIVKMGQDGKPDNVEANADRIQSELEELVKSLNERCKSYGLRAKPITLVELPFGWQSGLQEGAADWDENWDKFEDEGFAFVKELTLDVQNIIAPPKQKSLPVGKSSSAKEGVDVQSRNADSRSETLANGGERVPGDDHNEEGVAGSPPESPAHSVDSPSQKSPNSRKNFNADGSPHATEYQSEHGGAESVFSGDKGFDERSFTAFDTHYDTDSAWDFGSGPTKAMDYSGSAFFDAGDLGLPPIRTDSSHQKKSPFGFGDSVTSTPLFNSGNSPQADNIYQKNAFVFDSVPSTPQTDNLFPRKSTFAFDSVPSTPQADNLFLKKSTFAFDSVPSTPQADNLFQKKSTFSFDSVPSTPLSDNLFQQKSTFAFDSVPSTPAYNYSNEENAFDSFSRFDSFNESSRGFPPQGSFTRFDSMSSTRDSDYNQGFFPPKDSLTRFDSFSSTADSEINSQGFFPTKDYARFDSIRSTADYSDNTHGFHSFDDADPFGSSGPFKTSLEAQTPRRDSDQWRAF